MAPKVQGHGSSPACHLKKKKLSNTELVLTFYFKGILEEKPEQTANLHTERKEIASTVVNPMTSKEIQDQMSGFPEVIKNP